MANGIGIIDSDHRGEHDEVSLVIQNITNGPVTIEAGDRVAQAMILPVERAVIEEVAETGFADRGNFGSTGR